MGRTDGYVKLRAAAWIQLENCLRKLDSCVLIRKRYRSEVWLDGILNRIKRVPRYRRNACSYRLNRNGSTGW